MSSVSIPTVTVRGSAFERGLERGRAIPDRIKSRLDREVSSISASRRAALVKVGSAVETALAKQLPDVLAELRGIAEGARVSDADLSVAFAGMRGGAFAYEECSCFVASGTATRAGDLLLGKQADIPSLLSESDLIAIRVTPERGYAYVTIGMYPEQPVLPEGMNEAGLTVVGCGQRPDDGKRALERGLPVGVSVYDALYRVYNECATVGEAISVFAESPRGFTGRTMIVGDAAGDWARLEVSYERLSIRRPEPDAQFTTNFISAGVTGVFTGDDTHALVIGRSHNGDAYRRYDRYMELMERDAGGIDTQSAVRMLKDHDDGSPSQGTICRHGRQSELQTFASMIFEPQQRRAFVAIGRPCEAEFTQLSLF